MVKYGSVITSWLRSSNSCKNDNYWVQHNRKKSGVWFVQSESGIQNGAFVVPEYFGPLKGNEVDVNS